MVIKDSTMRVTPKPPSSPSVGDSWVDAVSGYVYYFDGTRWVATDHEGHVVDVIAFETSDHISNYDRAMGIL